MKSLFGLLIFLILLLPVCNGQSVYTDSRTGVVISFVTDENMFPADWVDDESLMDATNLNKADYARTRSIIQRALDKYPANIISKNLKKIYVLNFLSFENVEYGGTYSTDAVYVVNSGIDMGYDDVFVEQTFHHEFSSILFYNYLWPYAIGETSWISCNSDELGYGAGGFEALKDDNADMEFDDYLNEHGFLHEYGRSDKENDFNSFAENLFMPSEDFWYLIEIYPRLKCKLDLMIQLYGKLHPDFTPEYFKKFRVD